METIEMSINRLTGKMETLDSYLNASILDTSMTEAIYTKIFNERNAVKMELDFKMKNFSEGKLK